MKPKKGKVWKRLQPISKSPHKRAKRFVGDAVLAEVKARSGGRCECWVYTTYKGLESGPYKEPKLAFMDAVLFDEDPDDIKAILHRCHRKSAKIPHHILPRSQGGEHTADNLLDTCYFPHHNWIENNKAEAARRGLRKPYKNYTP